MERLIHYEWPGNIRELQNIVERIIAVCRQEQIPGELVTRMLQDDDSVESISRQSICLPGNSIEEISQALSLTRGRLAEAAKLLGISRSTLWRKMKALGLRNY